MKKPDHAGHVAAWLERAAAGASVTERIGLFETAYNALWLRAEGAVGGVALESITELIRVKAAERYPFLSPIAPAEQGLSCGGLAESAGGLDQGRLRESLAFMLTELLQVVGELTDEVLTPALYSALAKIGPEAAPRRPAGPELPPESPKETIPMTPRFEFISTGIPNLDEILAGGLIKGSSTALVGPPGSGKTILAQQIAFHNAAPKHPVLYFSTLSEPGAKTLFYLRKFDYYDPKKLDESIHFVDLGVLLRAKGLTQTLEIIFDRMRKLEPALVIVDSVKIFEDLAPNPEALRKFTYELVLKLMTRKCTALFLGEYAVSDYERSPLFSIIDGLVTMSQRSQSGEEQRFIKLVKMRGLAHSRNEHSFRITESGIRIYAPRLTFKHGPPVEPDRTPLCVTGIPKLDDLLGGGVPRGSSVLISGVAGTGKTVLGLEFIYRGALAGEKGIVFSFEETDIRLRAAAVGLGWDLDAQLASGMIEIVFVPQPDILIEQHLLMMQERVEKLGAARVMLDSLSVFLHKVKDPQAAREKVFQLANVIQNTEAVGFFAMDIPYGEAGISRFGVEETVVDGVIILSSAEEGLERQRYIEVYKLRNTAHLKGRHNMVIGKGGIIIYPRYRPQELDKTAYPPAHSVPRLSTGVGRLDALLGGGLLTRSITLVSGSSGIGKSILGLQFLLAGASRQEPGLYVTLEEGPEELLANAAALDLPLKKAVDDGLIEIVYLPPTHTRSTQVIAVLTDKIRKQKTKRMVLDSTTHLVASSMRQEDVRELLYDLVVRFKTQGVTCYFTLEADSMYSTDFSADRGYTPLADNIIVLRYSPAGSKVDSSLMVVKTRGSAHDQGLHSFTLGKGGLTLGGPLNIAPASQQTRPVAGGRKH